MPLLLPVSVILLLFVIAANIAQRQATRGRWFTAALLVFNVVLVLLLSQIPQVATFPNWPLLAVVGFITVSLPLWPNVRRALQPLFHRTMLVAPVSAAVPTTVASIDTALDTPHPLPLAPSFDPASPVHMLALVMSLYLVANNVLTLLLSGGISGIADDIASKGLDLRAQLLQMLLFVIFSLLGVGLLTRRTWASAVQRLGLRWPTYEDMQSGLGIAVLMVIVQMGLGILWSLLVSKETFEAQTRASNQIAQFVTSYGIAAFMALTAALGEEIAFRGALQPIFGLIPTSLFFAAIHIQYSLTPATLIILIVGLAFGWLRQKHSTTAAIIAHFAYNFAVMAMAVAARQFV